MSKTGKSLILIIFLLTFGILISSCGTLPVPPNRDFREDMRKFVIKIADYARDLSHSGGNPDFVVIPQNGQELITFSGESDGGLVRKYINTINGTGREDLFYGYAADNAATPAGVTAYFKDYLDLYKNNGVRVLVTDYCSDPDKMDESYSKNNNYGYISFAAPERVLDVIPDYPAAPFDENQSDILTLSDARNFLYLINPDSGSPESRYGTNNFPDMNAFISALKGTNHDLIIMDAFYGKEFYTREQIESLKVKKNGGKRLVVAYMSIGEAEDYRYYWKSGWKSGSPGWLGEENPDWEGNYKVWYWTKEWQDIIIYGKDSYLQKIMNMGFDGVYLDIIDAFEYFENI